MGDKENPPDRKQQRTNNDSEEQPSEKPSETSSSLGALLNPNQAPSQQGRSNDTQGGSKGSGSGSKKPKAIESGNAQPIANKNENQVQKRETQAGGDTAATASDPKTQGNEPNNKGKNKQEEPDPLARFRNTQGKPQDTTPLEFLTELERIEKCADTDYYGILGFPTDGNNVDTDIRTQRHIRLTQLMHPDKSEEEFKTRATGAIQKLNAVKEYLGKGSSDQAYAPNAFDDNGESSGNEGSENPGNTGEVPYPQLEGVEEANNSAPVDGNGDQADGNENQNKPDPMNVDPPEQEGAETTEEGKATANDEPEADMPDADSFTDLGQRIHKWRKNGAKGHQFIVEVEENSFEVLPGGTIGYKCADRFLKCAPSTAQIGYNDAQYTREHAVKFIEFRGVACREPQTQSKDRKRLPNTFAWGFFDDDTDEWLSRSVYRRILGPKYADDLITKWCKENEQIPPEEMSPKKWLYDNPDKVPQKSGNLVLVTDSSMPTSESVVEKRLSKTTKPAGMPKELPRTLPKETESGDAHVKMLESSVDRMTDMMETLMKQLATAGASRRGAET